MLISIKLFFYFDDSKYQHDYILNTLRQKSFSTDFFLKMIKMHIIPFISLNILYMFMLYLNLYFFFNINFRNSLVQPYALSLSKAALQRKSDWLNYTFHKSSAETCSCLFTFISYNFKYISTIKTMRGSGEGGGALEYCF